MNEPDYVSAGSSKPRSTTLEIGYIHPLRAGSVLGLLYALLALIILPFFLIGPVLQGGPGAAAGIGIGIFMFILYPVMGFIGGAIAALLYNVIAGWIGGFRIDVR